MSNSEEKNSQQENENLESVQKNQKKVGAAESDPSTTGSSRNLARRSCRKYWRK